MNLRDRFEKCAVESWGWDKRRLERNADDEYIDEGIADAWMAYRAADAQRKELDAKICNEIAEREGSDVGGYCASAIEDAE